jgi:hypothetical protein
MSWWALTGRFPSKTQLIDALIESYGRLKTSRGEGRPSGRSGYFRRHGRAPRGGIVLVSPLTVLAFEEPSEYKERHSVPLEGLSTGSPD